MCQLCKNKEKLGEICLDCHRKMIIEAKKEVLDDFENELRDRRHSIGLLECAGIYEKLKERHLTYFNQKINGQLKLN